MKKVIATLTLTVTILSSTVGAALAVDRATQERIDSKTRASYERMIKDGECFTDGCLEYLDSKFDISNHIESSKE